MADALSLMFGGEQMRPTPVQDAPSGGSALDLMFGQQKPPQVANKDLKYDPSRSMGFGQQVVAGFAPDESRWMRAAAKSLYPNEPVEASVQRFGKTPEGRYFHRGDDGQAYEVQPPSGLGRLANIGGGVGNALPVGLATATGIMTAPMAATGIGLAGTVGATAGAGALGETARQQIGKVLLGDEVIGPEGMNEGRIALEGAQSGLGQGVGTMLGQWFSRFVAPDIAAYAPKATQNLYDKAQNIGVRLTPGEATGMQSLIGEQKRLAGVPQSANPMKQFYTERNAEVAKSFDDFLNSVAPARDASRVGEKAAQSASGLLKTAQQQRTQAVTPLYQQAANEVQFVDAKPVRDYITQQLETAKGPIETGLKYAEKLITSKRGGNEYTLEGLDNAKKSIDALLKNPKMLEREGIDRNAAYVLGNVRDKIVEALDTASARFGSTAYAEARKKYSEQTQQLVEPLKDALAPLLRVKKDTTNLSQVVQQILDPQNRSWEQVNQAARYLRRSNPDLWNSVVRTFMQQEGEKALQVMASGEQRNVAGGLAKAFGSERMLANLKYAMEPGQYKTFTEALDVWRAAARAFDTNSDTAFKQEAIRLAKQQAEPIVAKGVRILNPAKAVERAADFLSDRNYAKQAEALANIVTSGDRTALAQIRTLKQLKDNDWRKLALFGELITRSGVMGVESALSD